MPRVPLSRHDVGEAPPGGALHEAIEHRLLHINDVEHAVGSQRFSDHQSVYAHARADFQDAFPRSRLQDAPEVLR
jgi:hypothetical protein